MNTKTSNSHGTDDDRSVSLPAHVLDRVETRLPRTAFETRDEYITYVLEEVLARLDDGDAEAYEAVDEGEIESRLESLGYL